LVGNAPRGCLDLQVPLDHRAIVQKVETEIPAAFFLFGHGERVKNAGFVG